MKIKAEDFPPCPGRTPICVEGKFGVRIVATGVVLRHSSPKCQVGSCPHLSLGPPTATGVMDQQGAELGSSKGRANTAEPYLRSL